MPDFCAAVAPSVPAAAAGRFSERREQQQQQQSLSSQISEGAPPFSLRQEHVFLLRGKAQREKKREFVGGKETDGRGIELQNAMVKQSFAFRAEIKNMAACSFSPSGIDRAAVKPAISTFARLADGWGKNVSFLQAGKHKFQPSSSSL